jgi:hypothetical protein
MATPEEQESLYQQNVRRKLDSEQKRGLRDEFAQYAMMGLLAGQYFSKPLSREHCKALAALAFDISEEMLEERTNRRPK